MEIPAPPPSSKFDWVMYDRLAYTRLSLDTEPPWPSELITKNTFCKACLEITKERRSAEFKAVRERNAYYDFISYVMEYTKLPDEKARGIKFFHATTAVTTWSAIGAIESLATQLPVAKSFMPSQDAINLLKEINEILFKENMYVIFCLLFTQDLKIPFEFVNNSPCVIHPREISAFDFDIQMVRFEQSMVTSYITNHSEKFTDTIKGEINDTLNPSWLKSVMKPDGLATDAMDMAKSGLKIKDLDFMSYRHRTAIGFASVHIFHRIRGDYNAFLKKINYVD